MMIIKCCIGNVISHSWVLGAKLAALDISIYKQLANNIKYDIPLIVLQSNNENPSKFALSETQILATCFDVPFSDNRTIKQGENHRNHSSQN